MYILVNVVGGDPLLARVGINKSVATQNGYIHYKFMDVRGYPWSLCVGDIDHNVDE